MNIYLLEPDGQKIDLPDIGIDLFEELIFNRSDDWTSCVYGKYNKGFSDDCHSRFLKDRGKKDILEYNVDFLKTCTLIIEDNFRKLIIPLDRIVEEE